MGKSSRKKKKRREHLKEAAAQLGSGDAPKMPPAFQNVILRPHNCMIILRGKDPKRPLPDGQLLVELDRYAVIPIEQYQDMQNVVAKRGGVFMDAEQVKEHLKKLQVEHALKKRKEILSDAPGAAPGAAPKEPQAPAQPLTQASKIARPTSEAIAHVQASKVQDAPPPAGDDPQ